MENAILIIGCDEATSERLTRLLEQADFSVLRAGDAVAGLFQLAAVQPALVIVDLDDCDALVRLRRVSSAPIIALTSDDGESGLRSLISGADFYVTRPPAARELFAKVRASLRRV
ncbi:MAG: hypothetical protein PVG11_00985 [Anaerolineae bacterium]